MREGWRRETRSCRKSGLERVLEGAPREAYEYRAIAIWRMPKRGPKTAKYAGILHDRMLKRTMHSAVSRKERPKSNGPRVPVENAEIVPFMPILHTKKLVSHVLRFAAATELFGSCCNRFQSRDGDRRQGWGASKRTKE